MKSFKEAQKKAGQLRQSLFGHSSKTYRLNVIDVFASPNDWINAELLYRERRNNSGYPLLATDDYTLMVAFEDHSIEEAGNVIINDGLMELQPLISDLPAMRNKKTDQEKSV